MRDTKPEGRGGAKWSVGAWVRYLNPCGALWQFGGGCENNVEVTGVVIQCMSCRQFVSRHAAAPPPSVSPPPPPRRRLVRGGLCSRAPAGASVAGFGTALGFGVSFFPALGLGACFDSAEGLGEGLGAGAGLASSAFFLPLALGRVAAGAGAGCPGRASCSAGRLPWRTSMLLGIVRVGKPEIYALMRT